MAPPLPPDLDPGTVRIIQRVAPYTMTGVERMESLCRGVEYIVRSGIPGAVVECGVWRGGSMMAAALKLIELGADNRHLYLFDTFDGMTPPTSADCDLLGRSASQLLQQSDRATSVIWAVSPLEDVRRAVFSTGYNPDRIVFVPGRVEETLPAHAPGEIALLRLDTDWYESTYHELTHLYPRLAEGGVLIIDDYGHWKGARRAVDQYFAEQNVRMFLHRIDYTGRIGVKQTRTHRSSGPPKAIEAPPISELSRGIPPPPSGQPASLKGELPASLELPADSKGERSQLPPGDYVSPNFKVVMLDPAFPYMVVGDRRACRWPYLRREVPHNWYVDRRQPAIGFVNRDEAHILYNTALAFAGKRALEIGCWLGWSACHLALGGVQLDVIDPLLAQPDFHHSVTSSLSRAGVMEAVNLAPKASPEAVPDVFQQHGEKWSLVFIDGDHDAPGPLRDAQECLRFAANDALILLHDLASPDVAAALDFLRAAGWKTMLYQTMQIMAVAWRGRVEPVSHLPDPAVRWTLPPQLSSYQVSGMSELTANGRGSKGEVLP